MRSPLIVECPAGGLRPTNVAFGEPDRRSLHITETENKIVTAIEAPRPGLRLFGDSDQTG